MSVSFTVNIPGGWITTNFHNSATREILRALELDETLCGEFSVESLPTIIRRCILVHAAHSQLKEDAMKVDDEAEYDKNSIMAYRVFTLLAVLSTAFLLNATVTYG